jgi:hypothetical protein
LLIAPKLGAIKRAGTHPCDKRRGTETHREEPTTMAVHRAGKNLLRMDDHLASFLGRGLVILASNVKQNPMRT